MGGDVELTENVQNQSNKFAASPLSLRFLGKVNIDGVSGCWLWTGSKRSEMGYGNVKIASRSFAAHRVSWEIVYGPIPPQLKVLHQCDVPACVNPDHLFLGTDKDNHQDKVSKGRHWQQKKAHCPQGHAYTPENTYVPPSGGRKLAKYKCNQKPVSVKADLRQSRGQK